MSYLIEHIDPDTTPITRMFCTNVGGPLNTRLTLHL